MWQLKTLRKKAIERILTGSVLVVRFAEVVQSARLSEVVGRLNRVVDVYQLQ
jgi:hypothetical protein